MRRRRQRSLAMGVVKRAEVILILAVGFSHRKVGQRLELGAIRPPFIHNDRKQSTFWQVGKEFGEGVAGVQQLQNQ
jgi:hypothetical protein